MQRCLGRSGYRKRPANSIESPARASKVPRAAERIEAAMGKVQTSPAKGLNGCSRDDDGSGRLRQNIRIGSDCSGLGADIFATKLLGIQDRIIHSFAPEVDEKTREAYLDNHRTCKNMYTSCALQDRTVTGVPAVDLYICGPPCQPFSLSGNRGGLKDKGTKEFIAGHHHHFFINA